MYKGLKRMMLGGALIALPTAGNAWAVRETVLIERPFHARSVSGIAMDPLGAPIAGATVDDCEQGFAKCIASATTDQYGQFRLPRSGRSVHYLRLTARGMNPLEITIALRIFAPSGVRLRLPIGG